MAQWSLLGREPLLDFLVSPHFVTPVSAMGCALLIHFVDPFLPLSFLNETSTPVFLGLAQSWSYPIDVLALTPVPPLLMLTAIIGFSARHRDKSIPTETVHFAVIFSASYVLLVLTLPNFQKYYVAPLWPVFSLMIISCGLSAERVASGPMKWAALVVMVAAVVSVQINPNQAVESLRSNVSYLFGPVQSYRLAWHRIREFA